MGGCCRCCCCAREAERRVLLSHQVSTDVRTALDLAEAGRELGADIAELGMLVNELVAKLPRKGLPYQMAMAGEILLNRAAKMVTQRLRQTGLQP